MEDKKKERGFTCPQCGGGLSVAVVGAPPMKKWQCQGCGSYFSDSDLGASKQLVMIEGQVVKFSF